MNNPLLEFSGLPLFDRITPADVNPAITDLLKNADAALAEVTRAEFPADWTRISQVLDTATEKLGRAWVPSVISKPWLTRPSCGLPTTQNCRASPNFGRV